MIATPRDYLAPVSFSLLPSGIHEMLEESRNAAASQQLGTLTHSQSI